MLIVLCCMLEIKDCMKKKLLFLIFLLFPFEILSKEPTELKAFLKRRIQNKIRKVSLYILQKSFLCWAVPRGSSPDHVKILRERKVEKSFE